MGYPEDIKNIIFDLGGVVIDLDRSKAVAALSALGIPDVNTLLGLYRQEGAFFKLETGHCSASEFFDCLRRMAVDAGAEAPTCRQIDKAFGEFLLGIPIQRLRRLRELREAGYRVYALSNTNPVMFHSQIAEFFRSEGLQTRDYFDGMVLSFEEGTCKPDEKIFQRLLRRYALEPEHTLMLDDGPANCEAARKAGMKALQVELPGGRDMMRITDDLLRS